MQSNNDFMGGYVKYFTDVPATHGYPGTVIFPRDDRMTVVIQSRFGDDQQLPPEGDGYRRGTKKSWVLPISLARFIPWLTMRTWPSRR